MLFGQQHRRAIAKRYPELTNKQISKILGKEWRNMGSVGKGFYHKLADEAHANHLIKYPGWLKSLDHSFYSIIDFTFHFLVFIF